MNKTNQKACHTNLLSGLTILICFFLSSCATRIIGTFRQVDFMGGYKQVKNVPVDEAEKKGFLLGVRYYKGLQTERLGQYGWAAGLQETHVEGKTSIRKQTLVNRSGFFDLSYFLPSGEERFLIGVLHRTYIGPGVEYGMNERRRWQLLSYVGPQIQKFLGERTVFGAALLHSYGFEKRAIVQIPIYIGWKF